MKLSDLAATIALMICTTGALAAPRYTITDLGPYFSFPSMKSLNNSGQTSGQLYTADGIEHASLTDSDGNVIDLGTLGGNYSEGRDINGSGQVTGNSYLADGSVHVFVTDSEGNMFDLGTLVGDTDACSNCNYNSIEASYGLAINDGGQVTGYANTSSALTRAFVTDRAGNMRDLGTLGGTFCIGRAINESGQVTGNSRLANSGEYHAFVTDRAGNMIDLGTLGGDSSIGWAINDSGQVTGDSRTPAGGGEHAFVTDRAGNMIDLGTLGGSSSTGRAINDRGQVTGYAYTASGIRHAFVTDSEGNMIDLGTLGQRDSEGKAINDSGQVTGRAGIRAFVTDNEGNMFDLNELFDNSSNNWGTLTSAHDISNSGYITGNGRNTNGESRAFLLTPIGPTPVITVEPIITSITGTTAIVSWETDIPATSVVNYGLTGANDENVSSETLKSKHSVVLTGLKISTLYFLNVTSVDGDGNVSETSRTITFKTLADTTPPVFTILPINKTIEATGSLTIVDLGNVSARDDISSLVTISNDAPESGFDLGVKIVTWSATDIAGNIATVTQVISVQEPTTAPTPPRVSMSTNGLNVTLAWNSVDGASGYKIYYAPYPYTGPESIGFIHVGKAIDFSIELWEGAAYYVAISAYNSAGESGYSNIEQFSLK